MDGIVTISIRVPYMRAGGAIGARNVIVFRTACTHNDFLTTADEVIKRLIDSGYRFILEAGDAKIQFAADPVSHYVGWPGMDKADK